MTEAKNYLKINLEAWNKRTEVHVNSAFYNTPAFIAGQNSLPETDQRILGNIAGLSVLHLQCHFGQDTISLSRMGAKVCGVDLSDKAIEEANKLAAICGTDTQFICSDLYNLPNVHDAQYDIVYTSYGTIGWLPDIKQWAAVVSRFLKPGGRLVFVEFHPVVWMYDNDFNEVRYPYYNDEAIIETESGSYADVNADINSEMITWNHGIAEVITALMNEGIQLTGIEEQNYSPYNCFNAMKEIAEGRFIVEKFGNKIPLVYALTGLKK
jgi:SAM-dependent methyltransferase